MTVKLKSDRVVAESAIPDSVHNGNSNDVAFALGGLAGNNAHAVGFLAAALEKRLKPLMISCTSGQIFWVSVYLGCLKTQQRGWGGNSDLRSILEREIKKLEPFPSQDANFGKLVLLGKEGVFQPPGLGYFADWFHNAATSGQRIIRDFQAGRTPFISREWFELPPEHLLNPDFSEEFYDKVATALQDSEIGIAFNSYNPAEGCEYVYLNRVARNFLQHDGDENRYEPGQMSSLSEPRKPRRVYEEISPDAVRRGLWLYWYGFAGQGDAHVDGAYFRQIMLSELTCAHTIYIARPLHFHWSGELPASWAGLEDLKTKMAFNGAYIGEKNQIELVNKLLRDAGHGDGQLLRKYHAISLKEIEMDRPRGFFGYVFEDISVFDQAYQKSMRLLPTPSLSAVPAGPKRATSSVALHAQT